MPTFSLPGARLKSQGEDGQRAARRFRPNWPRAIVVVLACTAIFLPLFLIFYQSVLSAPFFM
ncbi:MAG: hypothetical protein WCC39_06400, partial [Telluria sp.]